MLCFLIYFIHSFYFLLHINFFYLFLHIFMRGQLFFKSLSSKRIPGFGSNVEKKNNLFLLSKFQFECTYNSFFIYSKRSLICPRYWVKLKTKKLIKNLNCFNLVDNGGARKAVDPSWYLWLVHVDICLFPKKSQKLEGKKS